MCPGNGENFVAAICESTAYTRVIKVDGGIQGFFLHAENVYISGFVIWLLPVWVGRFMGRDGRMVM